MDLAFKAGREEPLEDTNNIMNDLNGLNLGSMRRIHHQTELEIGDQVMIRNW